MCLPVEIGGPLKGGVGEFVSSVGFLVLLQFVLFLLISIFTNIVVVKISLF